MRGNAGSGPRDKQFSQRSPGPGLGEGLAVLGLYGLWTIFVLFTYSRVPASEMYHVSQSGLHGGLSRALVFLGYPTALAAIAVLAVALDRILASGRHRRLAVGLALVAFVLAATIAVPGVVEEADLDAKPSNALAATGVVLIAVIAIWAARTAGPRGFAPRRGGDRGRLLLGAALLVVALPWVFAELGIFIGDIPPFGHIYESEQIWTSRKGETMPAVHLGHHHGMGGMLIIVTALLLSRELPRMRATALRTALAAYLSLAIAYGIGNMVNDVWYEQFVKRGWTHWAIPSVIRPGLTWMWGLVILVGAAIYLLELRQPAVSRMDER
jgi:hypothetical protein